MANSPTPTTMVLAVMAVGLTTLLIAAGPAAAQNWGCQPDVCCSKYGYCGTTSGGGGAPSGGASVASVVTSSFFNGIKSHAGRWCEGLGFYTLGAFLEAAGAYPGFARKGSEADGKREIAAFFAHVTHETGHMCYINEVRPTSNYCVQGDVQWPCYPGQGYFGRGPLQLSWNFNYGAAGRSIGFDGLKDPDTVAQDPVVSFKSALWFWMTNMQRLMPQGFGATIRPINGANECHGGKNTAEMTARVRFYVQYCNQFGVDPGNNLYC